MTLIKSTAMTLASTIFQSKNWPVWGDSIIRTKWAKDRIQWIGVRTVTEMRKRRRSVRTSARATQDLKTRCGSASPWIISAVAMSKTTAEATAGATAILTQTLGPTAKKLGPERATSSLIATSRTGAALAKVPKIGREKEPATTKRL